jgi:radical SAM protein with 4Fe4S-binding SPASM domain
LTINLAELESMRHFAEDELGVMFRFDAEINCRLDRSPAPLDFRLSPEQAVELDLGSPERLAEWRALAKRCGEEETSGEPDRRLYQCGGGALSFSIDPRGRLALCPFATRETYDLRAGRFADGWCGLLKDLRGRRTTRDTKCTRCALRSLCGMCPANGELENGDPESPVEYLCRLGHLRAYALGLTVPPHGDCEYCPGGAHFDEIMRIASSLQSRHHRDSEEDADQRGDCAA